ncbi:MAG: inner membrane protein YjiY [Planctomycetota bacterium]|jgi:carbon starvation protein
MEMLLIVVGTAIFLSLAYRIYGPILVRLFQLDDQRPTPAVSMRDDLDYAPCATPSLLNQHFSAIAAAGPIVGPILAGLYWGWGPALLWILLGSVFIGGVHDFSALVASIRHRATSITMVVRAHVSRRAYLLFQTFVFMALMYIVVAFTDITATMFVGAIDLKSDKSFPSLSAALAQENADPAMIFQSGSVATSSLLYLVLPFIMAPFLRRGALTTWTALLIFGPLAVLAILAGPWMPLNVDVLIQRWRPDLSAPEAAAMAIRCWDVFLLLYCAIASVLPTWLLLQPRGILGGGFMFAALGSCALGVVIGGLSGANTINLPRFRGLAPEGVEPLFPFLFITIACGACSGFHSLIASGTTSKQLPAECSARPVGYGAMLLEGMVAVLSLCCVMQLSLDSPLAKASPNFIYANGISSFLAVLGLNPAVGLLFALMAFNTFVYDTLDTCTRLGRFIVQELTGLRGAAGRWLGTIISTVIPLYFVTRPTVSGKPIWREFWGLFGASNQLLAALSLLAVTVWLWRTRRVVWAFYLTGIGGMVMYVMSFWALVSLLRARMQNTSDPVVWIAVLLLVLASAMLVEAIAALLGRQEPAEPQGTPVAVEV